VRLLGGMLAGRLAGLDVTVDVRSEPDGGLSVSGTGEELRRRDERKGDECMDGGMDGGRDGADANILGGSRVDRRLLCAAVMPLPFGLIGGDGIGLAATLGAILAGNDGGTLGARL
jgi:hypothetical protein